MEASTTVGAGSRPPDRGRARSAWRCPTGRRAPASRARRGARRSRCCRSACPAAMATTFSSVRSPSAVAAGERVLVTVNPSCPEAERHLGGERLVAVGARAAGDGSWRSRSRPSSRYTFWPLKASGASEALGRPAGRSARRRARRGPAPRPPSRSGRCARRASSKETICDRPPHRTLSVRSDRARAFRAHPARRRRAVDPDPALLSAAQGGLRGGAGDRRPPGAGPLRRAAVRPRRARPDAAADRRSGGLPAAAQPQLGADHHADGQVRGDRQGGRPGARAPTTTSPSRSRCASSPAGSRRRCGARR